MLANVHMKVRGHPRITTLVLDFCMCPSGRMCNALCRLTYEAPVVVATVARAIEMALGKGKDVVLAAGVHVARENRLRTVNACSGATWQGAVD